MSLDVNQAFHHLSHYLSEITNPKEKTPLAPIVAQVLQCPVAFVDESFHIMNAAAFDVDENSWNQLLESKQKQFWHAPKEYNKDGYVIAPLRKALGVYTHEVIFPIYQDNTSNGLEGAIFLLSSEKELSSEFVEILRFVSHSLSWVMWRHVRQSKLSAASQNHLLVRLLLNMLYGNIPSDEDRDEILNNCFFNVKQDFMLLVIEASASFDENHNLEKLTGNVNSIFPDSLTLCFSGDILILVPFKYHQDPQYAPLWEKLSKTLKKNKCYCGISSVFNSIDRYFLHHFVRGLSAARVARETKEEKNYAYYVDESIYDLIANGPPPFNIITLCEPALLKMVDHDKKYDSDYFYTLMCYWQLDRDTPRICKYMHIHKNTLYYRLSKIKAFLNRDIDNHASLMELNLSVSIMEYLGIIPKYRIRDEKSLRKKMAAESEE